MGNTDAYKTYNKGQKANDIISISIGYFRAYVQYTKTLLLFAATLGVS